MMHLQKELQRGTVHKGTAATPTYVNRPQQHPRRLAAGASSRQTHVSCRCSAEAAAVKETAEASAAAAPSSSTASQSPAVSSLPNSDVIELDFCSRPLLDERGKKVWELLVCSPDRSFEYSQYFPNNKINSAEVSLARVRTHCMIISVELILWKPAHGGHRRLRCRIGL